MPNELKPKIKYIELKKPEVKFDLLAENPSAHFTRELTAKVVDHQDKVLCDAIIQYATERGYTDIFLIDEEFIRSAITHEIMRRNGYAEDSEIAELYETISKCYLNAQRRASDEQAD
jgi:hypothetical protein